MADQITSQADLQADTAPEADVPKRKQLFRILAIVVAVIAALALIWYFLFAAGRVSTDNAYVGADVAQVTPVISGNVVDVLVSNTQQVKKGDVLITMEDTDARIAVAEARADLRMAEQKYRQANANVDAGRATVGARGADIMQARAKLAEAQANADRARLEYDRRQALAASGAVSGEELSTAKTMYQSAQAALMQARAAVTTASATQAMADGDLAATEAMVKGTTADTAPEILASRARLEKAELDLARTTIRAPVGGIITNKQVQIGQRLAAGTTIMAIVPTETAYVDANYKESQLRHVRPGQPVELVSDYYGDDVVFHGTVTGFSGGTGSAFALIPAQNATGNWVKVVQRLPVRIKLDPKQLREHPLRVGLSMEAIIDTRAK